MALLGIAVATVKQCIQEARRLLDIFEEHGVDEEGEGTPESREALLQTCGKDVARLLRRLGGISTARLSQAVASTVEATMTDSEVTPAADPICQDLTEDVEVVQAPDPVREEKVVRRRLRPPAGKAFRNFSIPACNAAPKPSTSRGMEVERAEGAVSAIVGGGTVVEAPAEQPSLATKACAPACTLLAEFRYASKLEVERFPDLCRSFETWMEGLGKMAKPTSRTYSNALSTLFNHNLKAPGQMATREYRIAVKNTLENRPSGAVKLVSLRHFARFWEEEGQRLLERPATPEVMEEARQGRNAVNLERPRRLRLRLKSGGKAPEEARLLRPKREAPCGRSPKRRPSCEQGSPIVEEPKPKQDGGQYESWAAPMPFGAAAQQHTLRHTFQNE